jgi:hypothetical protein
VRFARAVRPASRFLQSLRDLRRICAIQSLRLRHAMKATAAMTARTRDVSLGSDGAASACAMAVGVRLPNASTANTTDESRAKPMAAARAIRFTVGLASQAPGENGAGWTGRKA